MHLLELAQGAQQSGHEITILAGGRGVFLDRATTLGIRCITLQHMVREISPFRDWLAYKELKKHFRSLAPDIIHLHSSKAGTLGRLAARDLSVPVIFTAHGWAFTEGVSPVRRALYICIEKALARLSAHIITVSEYDRALAIKAGVGNEALITTIHNGIADDCREIGIKSNEGPVRLIMVARFDTPKRQRDLLLALSKLPSQDWTAEFVGSGPTLAKAREFAREQQLLDRVIFSGACDDVPDRLQNAHVFVLVSDWEGLPLSILEAMRAKLPVIASKVGGVPEAVMDGETGLLVDRGDTHSLAIAIKRLITQPGMRESMGMAGRTRFDTEFTFQTMMAKTLSIYNSAISNGPFNKRK